MIFISVRMTCVSAVACALVGVVAPPPIAAQTCVGDCSGQLRVTISDLVLAVNIALGRAPVDQCPALGAGPVTVSTLVTCVNNALRGCAVPPSSTPTDTPAQIPSATATATVTAPTATATEAGTPTETPVAVESMWVEDRIDVGANNCPSLLIAGLQQALRNTKMSYTVRQRGSTGEIETERSDVVPATFDPGGTMHATFVINDDSLSCPFTLELGLAVNLSESPTTAHYDGNLATVEGCTTPIDCSGVLTSRWTLASPTPAPTP